MTLKRQQEEIQKQKEFKMSYEKCKNTYDILNVSRRGVIEADRIVSTEEIRKMVDVGTREKAYSLVMDDGPYTVRYSPSGDGVLYLGQKEVISMNPMKLAINCERKMGDEIYDGTFLHSSEFYALAQSKAVYIYNKQGVEIHVLRDAKQVRSVKFLQDHFLLASVSEGGYLRYQDTSIGKLISEIKTKERNSKVETDRVNGVVYLTGSAGTVSLWSPRSPEYLAKILCHRSKVNHCKISDNGRVLYTASRNEIKKWDIRNMFKPMEEKDLPGLVVEMGLSQTGKLAVTQKGSVVVYDDALIPEIQHHTGRDVAHSLAYRPYEDILTLGTGTGVESIIVPGAGLETYRQNENPHMSRKERKDAEVRRILEKIPADMISLESEIGTEMKEVFAEETVPMKYETPAGKVRRLMKINYG